MFKKFCVFTTAILLSFSALSTMSKDECVEAAEQIFAAQNILNQAPALFKSTSEQIKAASPEDLGMSQELKDFVVAIAGKLKSGMDPQAAGVATFQGCMAKLKVT